MSRRVSGALAAMCLLVACEATGPTPRVTARPKPSPVASRSPAPTPSPTPSVSASLRPASAPPVVVASPVPEALVQDAGSVKLSGVIRIDASYVLAVGAGRVVSNNGAAVLELADAGLISNNGGNLISDKGGSLISDKGGSLISDKGFGLIGNNGGNAISNYFGLLQTTPTVAQGELLPAAGMLVGVQSLADGQAMPIGVDSAGKPAYAIYSNAAGGYAIYLPGALAQNVRVVALPPAKSEGSAQDARLLYGVITDPGTTAQVAIDEDTALVSQYMRGACKTRLLAILSADDVTAATEAMTKGVALAPFVKDLVDTFAREMNAEAKASGLQKAPANVLDAVAQRILDVTLGYVALDKLVVDSTLVTTWTRPPTATVPLVTTQLKLARDAATAALQRDPTFFERQAYMTAANATRPVADAYTIKKGADLNAFLINVTLNKATDVYPEMEAIFQSLGLSETLTNPAGINTHANDIAAGSISIVNAILTTLMTNEGQTKDKTLALIRAYKP